MTATVYLNGEFVDESEAKLSVCDGGWLHGAGLFETMGAENSRVFRLELHMRRLCRSAATLLTPLERGVLPSPAVIAGLLERNGLTEARIRLTVSAAAPSRRLQPAQTSAQLDTHSALTVCLTAAELSGYASGFYENGIQVAICDSRLSPTDPIAGHKTTAYLPRLLALRDAQRAKCTESLWFTTANQLAEGSISNVFIVHEGVLKTPPLNTPVLPGITRATVLEIARGAGVETQECPLTIDDLLDADEVLLTNSIMQVMPVIRVEKSDIGDGRVGSIAKRLLEDYRKLVQEECGDQ